jgi:hypothetical protein
MSIFVVEQAQPDKNDDKYPTVGVIKVIRSQEQKRVLEFAWEQIENGQADNYKCGEI